MVEAIEEFFSVLFANNSFLATIIISIIPLIELKGAIPFGMSRDFWGDFALFACDAFFASILGGIIVAIIWTGLFKPIYNAINKKMFKGFISFFVGGAKRESEKINKELVLKTDNKKQIVKIVGVIMFVAIPLPGTGVYSGVCLAILLGLNYWQVVLYVTIGNIIAGILVMFVCSLFPEFTSIIFAIFILLVAVFVIYKLINHFINKKRTV